MNLLDHQEPSTSKEFQNTRKAKTNVDQPVAGSSGKNDERNETSDRVEIDKELDKVMTVEEFLLKSKTYMLEYEKYMFLDTIDSDCLVVCAKCVNFLTLSPECTFLL